MNTDEMLSRTCESLTVAGGRIAELLVSAPDLSIRAHRCEWTLQQVGAHLTAVGTFFTELANGVPSFVESLDPVYLRREAERYMADISETDPARLSKLMLEAIEGFADAASHRSGDHPVTFHAGLPYTLAGAAGVALGEFTLHGYDMATVLEAPWPIDAGDAALMLAGYTPMFGLTVCEERTRGLSAAFGIELRGVGGMTVRFTGGAYGLEEAGGPVDAILSADPIAFLLVAAGRISRYEAIALGLLQVGGPRPELGLRFHDLFVFP